MKKRGPCRGRKLALPRCAYEKLVAQKKKEKVLKEEARWGRRLKENEGSPRSAAGGEGHTLSEIFFGREKEKGDWGGEKMFGGGCGYDPQKKSSRDNHVHSPRRRPPLRSNGAIAGGRGISKEIPGICAGNKGCIGPWKGRGGCARSVFSTAASRTVRGKGGRGGGNTEKL